MSNYVALYRLVMGYEQLFTSNNCDYFNSGNKMTKLFASNTNLMFAYMKNLKNLYTLISYAKILK